MSEAGAGSTFTAAGHAEAGRAASVSANGLQTSLLSSAELRPTEIFCHVAKLELKLSEVGY